ncbi:double-strand break repair protein AddB [Alphaproteobacteria bacterium]|nr:double-strand break repair protein AddB [Alphaproteobacteria bacterium]
MSPLRPLSSSAPPDASLTGLYSIQAGRPFASDLASGLIQMMPDKKLFASAHILVPSHRAVQALSAAFLEVADGQPLMLPAITALGDVDEFLPDILGAQGYDLPPAMDRVERHLILAHLIQGMMIGGRAISPPQALSLSISLCALLDQVSQSGGSPDGLADIMPDDFADHWADIRKFLDIIFEQWPDIAAQKHVMDSGQRSALLLSAQCDDWQQNPPAHPVIIAGSTGSLLSTRALMKTVMGLPQGFIVLPGLPEILFGPDDYTAIRADIGHPFHQLLETLAALDVMQDDVKGWVFPPDSQMSQTESHLAQRRALFMEVFRPAEQSYLWRRLAETHRHITRDALASMRRIDAVDMYQEADIIACLMRKTLEHPTKTATLVTADRTLARHVRAALMRWQIQIDDSAGVPQNETSVGHYLQLVAEWAQTGGSAKALLALAKHPLASGGMQTVDFRKHVRAIERHVLRGYLPDSSAAGIAEKLVAFPELLAFYQTHILLPLAPITDAFAHPVPDMARLAGAHGTAAENFAQTDIGNAAILTLWGSPSGKEAAALLERLAHYGQIISLTASDYPAAFLALTKQITVRSAYSTHSRLTILGTVEARMQSADLVILGGLNEGVWPPHTAHDPWTNTAMRSALGLPDRRWRTGLSAHDFFMNVCAPEIIITRALRVDDVPTTPSRWLERLGVVLTAIGHKGALAIGLPDDIAAILAAPRRIMPRPCAMPQPRPALSLRPRKFSATDFDKWITDPYQIYAQKILKLRRLDPVDRRPDAALKGMLFHDALAQFSARYDTGPLPDDAFQHLMACARSVFKPYLHHPQISEFWLTRFEAVARWFCETEDERRADMRFCLIEKRGRVILNASGGPFELSAIADRLDFHQDGSWTIIDYKTGEPPSAKQVKAGRATQLLIEAVIATGGGYDNTAPEDIQTTGNLSIRGLTYWKLKGRQDAPATLSSVLPADFDGVKDIEQALIELVSAFDDEARAYDSEPDSENRPRFSDYRHLARVREWRPEEGPGD